MIGTTPRQISALLFLGAFLVGGCGSVTGNQPSRSSGIAGEAVGFHCVATSEPACPGHPVRATIDVMRADTRSRVATVHTDTVGRFGVSVPPGDYELVSRTSDHLLWARPTPVQVGKDLDERVQVRFFLRHPLPVGPARGAA
jgi:hypothetical protein